MKPGFADKAALAWGIVPEWVARLASECDANSLRKVSALLGVSPALTSLAINNGRENYELIKGKVEARLMLIGCPVLGLVETARCQREQALDHCAGNPLRVKLYQACRSGCQYYKGVKK